MQSVALGLLAVTLAANPNNLLEELNLDPRGEAGYLWSGYTVKEPGQPLAWKPREGDLVFMTSPDLGQRISYALARTWHPFHVGLVVRRSNGELALLESGGAQDLRVTLLPIIARMNRDDLRAENRFYWVRRFKGNISPEQSAVMTAYAEAQIGKAFVPYSRLTWFWLPGRPAPHRTTPEQEKWFCSEIVVAVLQAGNVLPQNMFKPGSATPRELFMDCLFKDISDLYHAPLPWSMFLASPPIPGPRFAPYRARE